MHGPHVLAIPHPAQGHVIPLLELMQCLARHGVKITFVNTEFNQERVRNALPRKDDIGDRIHLISIPDGLEAGDDRNDVLNLIETSQYMPGKLVELIEEINESGDKITCIIADQVVGWALEVAETMHIRRAAFWPAAATLLGLSISIPKLLDDGIIDDDGTPRKNQMVQLSPKMPAISTAHFPWACVEGLTTQKKMYELALRNNKAAEGLDWLVCNSIYELEPAVFELFPRILPLGPLLAKNRLGNSGGYFWQEDSTCLEWLDQQEANCVIYIAFGSSTVLDQTQFQELALGLEQTNRPFLWVVRPNITEETDNAYPKGFKDRIATRGRIVRWAPQQKVLGHPSVACFLSHCGWNSTIEGISNGIPFLCRPYFIDQFLNQSYITDVWKVGLTLNQDESGIIKQAEIKEKVEQLLLNQGFKARAMDLKEVAEKNAKEGGRSRTHLNNFIEWVKA